MAGNLYSLIIIGPSGNWKISKMQGVKSVSAQKGVVPATLTVERDPNSDAVLIEFEYTSPQVIRTVFGELIPTGKPYKFDFQRFEKQLNWRLQFFNLSENDSLAQRVFSEKSSPVAEQSDPKPLYYAWWGSPAKGVNEDHFATQADTQFEIAPGTYVLELTSDDGVRLYLDNKLLIDHWDVHEPSTDEVTVQLGGSHQLRIEHFDAGGFATLDFRIRPKR